ncbi:MAG: TetR/AcrR family transcriptional regulator [Gammaproteobacteria bacterium]
MAVGKADLQRDRILTAAQTCFIEHGFHSASMASIAATAEMSAGLIYRYFASKNEIIIAIIERQLALLRREIAALDGSVDLATALADTFCQGESRQHGLSPALLLEMSAEATRDPAIAAALHEFDDAIRADLCKWFERSRRAGGHGCELRDAKAKALALQCFVEGMRVREAREPDLDRHQLADAIGLFVRALRESNCDAD